MKRNLISIFLFLLLIPNAIYCMDCEKLSLDELYKRSDLIAVGKFEHYDDDFYYISIQELFKGKSDSIIVIDKKNAPQFQKSKYWLIYSIIRDGIISVSPCSGTKSFDAPIATHNILRSGPPPQFILKNKTLYYLWEHEYINNSKIELLMEIISLRQIRSQSQILSLKKDFLSTKDTYKIIQQQYSKMKDQNNLIIGILILESIIITVFLLILLFGFFRQNDQNVS